MPDINRSRWPLRIFGKNKIPNDAAQQHSPKSTRPSSSSTLTVPGSSTSSLYTLSQGREHSGPDPEPDPVVLATPTKPAQQTPVNNDAGTEKSKLWGLAFQRASCSGREITILMNSAEDDQRGWSPSSWVDDLKVIQEVEATTLQRCTIANRCGWKSDKSGGELAIREQAEKVLGAVLGMKDLISAGLKFDVTGYAATA